MRRPFSLAGKLSLVLAAPLSSCAVMAALTAHLGLPPLLVALASLLTGLAILPLAASRFLRPSLEVLDALSAGARAIRSHDFSMRLAVDRGDELGELAAAYNQLVDHFGSERRELRQRELLLETVLDSSPTAVLLVNSVDRIAYSNRAARQIFHRGRRLEGHAMAELAAGSPEPLRRALEAGSDTLVAVPTGSDVETLYVQSRHFVLNTQPHAVITIAPLTNRLRRQEVAVWKRVIRTISHELRNSIAPIRSLVHSARLMRERELEPQRLDEALDQIDQAAAALARFVEGYSRFARLPEPRLETVDLRTFLVHLQQIEPFALRHPVPARTVQMDPGQMQQVLVNLLHNAREAGSPEESIALRAEEASDGAVVLSVVDRGPGMDEDTMSRALLPYTSSKRDGAGLGLAICREILEAHGGMLSIESRRGGGLAVRCRLPPHG